MNKKITFSLLLLVFIFFSFSEDLISMLAGRLEVYRTALPKEKVFVHTDKQVFAIGETIWFKVYLTKGAKDKPSDLSKVAYVQFLAPDGQIVETKIIETFDGSGSGEFRITGAEGEGVYSIRAYTNYIRNDEDQFFEKKYKVYDFRNEDDLRSFDVKWIQNEQIYDLVLEVDPYRMFNITNPDRKLTAYLVIGNEQIPGEVIENEDNTRKIVFSVPRKLYSSKGKLIIEMFDENWEKRYRELTIKMPLEKIDLQFFPEGGDMIAGEVTRLAFKAIGPDGLSRRVSGSILNQKDEVVANFTSSHAGMGVIPFIPAKGETYKAILDNYREGEIFEIKEWGNTPLILNVDQTRGNVLVSIIKDSKQRIKGDLSLVAQSGYEMHYAANIDTRKSLSTKIPFAKFPNGIIQFTLFADKVPVSERLIFIDKSTASLSLSTNKDQYGNREKVNLNLKLLSDSIYAPAGDFSVTVTDAKRVTYNSEFENIMSYLLLSSNLRGNIENPGYYFNPSNEKRKEHLDILMLTQGWRSFNWEKLLDEELTLIIPEYGIEEGLTLPGRLTKKINDNKGSGGGEVSLLTKGELQDAYNSNVNEEGEFFISGIEVYGKQEVEVFGTNKRGKPFVNFEIDSNYHIVPARPHAFNSIVDIDENTWEFINHSQKVYQINLAYPDGMQQIMLDEIMVTGEMITEADQEYRQYNKIYQRADYRLDVDKLPGKESAYSAIDLLIGRIPGLVVNGTMYDPNIYIRGQSTNGSMPAFVVDGVITDKEVVMNIPVFTIDHIDVLKPGPGSAMFGSQGGNGVIAIYTKRGEDVGTIPENGVYRFEMKGFDVPTEFYSPNYSVQKDDHVKPDVRTTLYWNPEVKTDSTGTVDLSFYTHDLEGDVRIEVQGLDAEGNKFYKTHMFRVSKEGS